jgi:hypothetical protein
MIEIERIIEISIQNVINPDRESIERAIEREIKREM